MTTTRPKRITRNATPAPPVEDDATIVRTTLDRIVYTVDVMARFDQTREDIMSASRGEGDKTMAQVMTEVRWHEHASKARKECPLGSSKRKRHREEEEEEEDDEDNQDAPSTSKPPKTPKPTPEKKNTPSKAKLAALKKKADAARRKAQREAKKLAELEEREREEDDGEADESFVGMPLLEKSAITPPSRLSPNPHLGQNVHRESYDLSVKPWMENIQMLYPLDVVPVFEDVPGRVWCPPRGLCQATSEQVVEVGPLTELETLDLSLCPEFFTHLLPEKADLIIGRMLELQIPYLEMKLLNPDMSEEDREANIKQLEVYEKQLEENMDKDALLRMKILNLPGTAVQVIPRYRDSIQQYKEFHPTWYSSSRVWFDKSIRKSGEVTQQDFLDQFEETDNQMILDFQREMLEKAKAAEEEIAADKIKKFKMPLTYSIEGFTPVIQEKMLAFRDKLAHIFQYENFEEDHMSDPACRGIWRKLQPLPYDYGAQADEAEEELIALISSYKIQFGRENPIIPLPEADDDDNETPSEVEAATKRFLSDVIDTVVLREVTDLPTYPHRIPVHQPHPPRIRPASLISESNSRSSSSDRRSSSPTQSD